MPGTAVSVTVRYFAGARAAAGTEQEVLSLPDGATVADVCAEVSARHGQGLTRVLAAASFLVDEVVSGPDRALADGASVDVLPPFAGG